MSYRSSVKSKIVKKPFGGSSNRPDFIMISNIYDDLSVLVDKYGINKVVEHLGHVAHEKISKEFAGRIWWVVSK